MTTIRFAGHEWAVKDGKGLGPGPNDWDERNVGVDEGGRLHLMIANRDRGWTCAQVSMTEPLGLGLYRFEVSGTFGALDPNVVLGMYVYPPASVGPDGTHEIDVELARWGRSDAPVGNYVVWPPRQGIDRRFRRFRVDPSVTRMTHVFVREPAAVRFASEAMEQGEAPRNVAEWDFAPADATERVSAEPMPVRMNLWLYRGRPPKDRSPVEVVVEAFEFVPLQRG